MMKELKLKDKKNGYTRYFVSPLKYRGGMSLFNNLIVFLRQQSIMIILDYIDYYTSFLPGTYFAENNTLE